MNINIIPFRQFRLRIALGPANPRLINSAEELGPSGGADSHHTVLLLFPRLSLVSGPQDLKALLPPKHYAALPHHLSMV